MHGRGGDLARMHMGRAAQPSTRLLEVEGIEVHLTRDERDWSRSFSGFIVAEHKQVSYRIQRNSCRFVRKCSRLHVCIAKRLYIVMNLLY